MKTFHEVLADDAARVRDPLAISVPAGGSAIGRFREAIETLLGWTGWLYFHAPGKRATRFLLRALLWPTVTLDWLRHVESHANLSIQASRQVGLIDKIHRPYLSSAIPAAQRLTLLKAAYAFVEGSRWRCALWAALDDGLPGVPCGVNAELRLFLRHARNPREGEFELCLEDPCGLRLCSLSFSVIRDATGDTVMVGGLQGALPGHEAAVRRASASIGSLPVKQYLARVVVQMSSRLGLSAVVAVDDSRHVYRSWRYRLRRRLRVRYADTWSALGGQPASAGWWRLEPEYVTGGNAVSRSKAPLVDAAAKGLCDVLWDRV